MRYREGRLKKIEDNTERQADIEPMSTSACETDCPLKRILRSCFRECREYFTVFSAILMVEFCVLFTTRTHDDIVYIFPILTAIILVVFRTTL